MWWKSRSESMSPSGSRSGGGRSTLVSLTTPLWQKAHACPSRSIRNGWVFSTRTLPSREARRAWRIARSVWMPVNSATRGSSRHDFSLRERRRRPSSTHAAPQPSWCRYEAPRERFSWVWAGFSFDAILRNAPTSDPSSRSPTAAIIRHMTAPPAGGVPSPHPNAAMMHARRRPVRTRSAEPRLPHPSLSGAAIEATLDLGMASMRICSLASGSSGNATYIATERTAYSSIRALPLAMSPRAWPRSASIRRGSTAS